MAPSHWRPGSRARPASPSIVLDAIEHHGVSSIIAFARSRIAAYKAPKSVNFIDVLPRNPSGKILRRLLREPYWAGRDRQVN